MVSDLNSQPRLEQTGFELPTNTSRTLQVPNPWVGQIWARNGCKFDKSGFGSCATGNCASGKIECEGAVDASPATLVDFTLGPGAITRTTLASYTVVPLNGTGTCRSAGCKVDLNLRCPTELRAANGLACKSSCIAFGTPDHCCRGAFGLHDTCKPSNYSVIFKSACPRSLIIGYSDTKSTFSCRGADYRIAFLPLKCWCKLNNTPPTGGWLNRGTSKKSAKKFTSAASITTEEPERTGPRLYIRRLKCCTVSYMDASGYQ
ncbi:unnamed protein product [Thlaspi arvense]|uniref:Thaumatin-like protein n=1 Tax=Thlaspi arvense TaxID=13288 RepID=A0AAU9RGH8_THLAR|nr:unnamed protein product [Thlaspi arvense]